MGSNSSSRKIFYMNMTTHNKGKSFSNEFEGSLLKAHSIFYFSFLVLVMAFHEWLKNTAGT